MDNSEELAAKLNFEDLTNEQVANVIIALIILVAGWLLIKFAVGIIKKRLRKRSVDENIIKIVSTIAKTILYTVLFVVSITVSGVPVGVMATVLSALILAVALSLKDSLELFADGIILTVSKPFKVGDLVEIPSENILGYVINTKVLHTFLRTKDHREVIIPNDIVANNTVINYTKFGVKRIDVEIEVAHGSDIEFAKKIITDVAKSEPDVRNDFKEPFVVVKDINNNAVSILCRVYANWDYYDELDYILHDKIRTALSENGIEMPFTQIDVHIKQ